MDHKHLYLESCQKPTSLNVTTLDEDLNYAFPGSERLDNSDIPTQMINGAVSGQVIPKTSTPAKKSAAGTDSPRKQEIPDQEGRAEETESATRGAGGEAMGGAKDGAAATVSPSPNASSPQQNMSTVPEPIAEITTSNYVETSPTGYLCNPDIGRRSETGAELQSEFSFTVGPTTMSSLMESAEDCQKLKQGYIRQCSRANLRHSQSLTDIASLTNSVSSQHDQIESNGRMIGFIMDDVKNSKARLEALEKGQIAGSRHRQHTTTTHFIPYDSEKKQGLSFVLPPTTDLKLRAELFLVGFGSGSGTHLSLKVTADTGSPNKTDHLPSQCRFEILIHNFDDEEETRKKSKNSEENGGSHIVEFPKVIEKDVVENEALGFKRNGRLKITLIVSWDEVINQ
eukprot:XP_011663959.1 PREDICTED: uncharacterized protein LOC105438169 [Strongylocentrotus purpuratus]